MNKSIRYGQLIYFDEYNEWDKRFINCLFDCVFYLHIGLDYFANCYNETKNPDYNNHSDDKNNLSLTKIQDRLPLYNFIISSLFYINEKKN